VLVQLSPLSRICQQGRQSQLFLLLVQQTLHLRTCLLPMLPFTLPQEQYLSLALLAAGRAASNHIVAPRSTWHSNSYKYGSDPSRQ
jgi:hypothetical protein